MTAEFWCGKEGGPAKSSAEIVNHHHHHYHNTTTTTIIKPYQTFFKSNVSHWFDLINFRIPIFDLFDLIYLIRLIRHLIYWRP